MIKSNRSFYFTLLVLILFILSSFATLKSEWTIVATYEIPENGSGLAYDGSNLYCGMYGANGDEVYQIDPTNGDYTLLFSGDMEDTFGMTYDGSNLWVTDHAGSSSNPAYAMEFDLTGNLISQFDLPTHYMSGIAYDQSDGNFWVSAYYDPDGEIYKVDPTNGNILNQFPAPDAQPWDLCLENGNIWIADYYGDALYKVDATTGALIESHDSEGSDPAGIVYDGSYLWYIDNGQNGVDYLYKVDLTGGGTPSIQLGQDEYDYGNTIIGELGVLDLTITNTGSDDLVINSVTSIYPSIFYSDESFLLTISAGSSEDCNIIFEPSTWGEFDDEIIISSNDPVNPEVEINLEGYGIYSEQEIETDLTSLDFGDIRSGALSGRFIEISNQGNSPLIIDQINSDNNDFFFENNLTLPIQLGIREEYNLRIWFSKDDNGESLGNVTIHSNDADEENLIISVSSEAIDFNDEIGTEYWSFDTNEDNEKIVALKNFIDLNGDGVKEILVADNEYHVYCLNGNSSGTADIMWVFSSAIDYIGFGSIYDERGLTVTNDVNGDGINDVVIGTAWGSRSIFTLDGSNGEIIWHYNTNEYGDGGWVYQVDAQMDYNQDGINDVLAACGDDGSDTGPRSIYLLNGETGDKIWNQRSSVATYSAVCSYPTIDYDNIPEVIAGQSYDGGIANVQLLNGQSGNIIQDLPSSDAAVWAVTNVPPINTGDFDQIVYGTFYDGNVNSITYQGTSQWSNSGTGIITRFDKKHTETGVFLLPTVLGTSSFTLINTFDGSVEWFHSLGGNILDLSIIEDVTGDNHFDVIAGTLDNKLYFVSGSDGESFHIENFSNHVDQTLGIDDLDNNYTPEILAGLRDGNIKCFSGGNDANDIEGNYELQITNYELKQNYPNPFNPITRINYTSTSLSVNQSIEIVIHNTAGQQVWSSGNLPFIINHSPLYFDGSRFNSGVYYYSLVIDGKRLSTKSMVLLK